MMFIRSYCFMVIPFGTVGHLLSIYVFTHRSLRLNPCGIYFLAATITGLVNTCYSLPMRMIQSAFIDTDPGAYSVVFCKITWLLLNSMRYVKSNVIRLDTFWLKVDFKECCSYLFITFLFSYRGLAYWFIVLACADRYFRSCASANTRAWSSVRVARRTVPLTILIIVTAYSHVPMFFKIDIIPATQKPICYPPGPPGTYRIILSYFNLIVLGLSPSFSMLILGLLTLRNIRRTKQLSLRHAPNCIDITK